MQSMQWSSGYRSSCPSPTLFPANDSHALNLDQKAGLGQPGDGDQRTRREAFLEGFLAELDETVAEPRVGDEHGHRHHVREAAAAGGLDVLVELRENSTHLLIEIGGRRAGLTS